ncbi:MAG TPA: hypothetical protein VHM90_02965 [Phycisphaerae bacterium]|nr:hypothetical protein [Phycisphaerae bacterium]
MPLLAVPFLAACVTSNIAWNSAPRIPRKFATLPITNPRSLAVDSAGNLYVGESGAGTLFKIGPDGRFSTIGGSTASEISDPLGLGIGPDGAVYVANGSAGGIYRIAPGANAAPIAVSGADLISTPAGVAIDSAGNAFIANNGDNAILKITAQGVVSVFAGNPGTSGSADGKGSSATFATPRGIAIDGRNNLYVADEGNSNIRKITPDGTVTTLAGNAHQAGSADGTGTAASFAAPRSLTAARDGTVYVVDTDNHAVRKIAPGGVVTTLAGKPGESGYADGRGGAARFSEPRGIAVDAAGNVYVADTGNAAIREISPDGNVTTIAAAEK